MRISKEEAARREGIYYAYRIVKEGGIEALEKDIKNRGITDCPVGISKADMNAFANNVRMNVVDTFLIMNCTVLQDEFGFGKKRIERFIERFNLKASVIAEDYATWDDFKRQLNDELGIELSIRENDKDVVLRKERNIRF